MNTVAEYVDLGPLLRPAGVAVVGASSRPGALGNNTARNLLVHSRVPERVYLVSGRDEEIFGQQTIGSLSGVPAGAIDVVLVLRPPAVAVETVRQAAALGARFAVVLSAGFAESGTAEGVRCQAELTEIAASTGIRIMGPNCPGLGDIRVPLGLTIQPGFGDELVPGGIGLVAQSGGLTRTLLQGMKRGLGYSAFFSPGNQADLGIHDYVGYLAADKDTRVIVVVAEAFKDAAKFLAAARLARENGKHVLLFKMGRSEAGRQAAVSHTGSLIGSDEAMRAVCKRAGVVVLDGLDDLQVVASYLARGRVATAGGVGMYGFSGGSGVALVDEFGARGTPVAELSEKTAAELAPFVGENPCNPVDFGGHPQTRDFDRVGAFRRAFEVLSAADEVGVSFLIFNAWYAGRTKESSDAIKAVAASQPGAVIPLWLSERREKEFFDLDASGLTCVTSIRQAAAVADALFQARDAGQVSGESAAVPLALPVQGLAGTLLEAESKTLLAAAGVPVTADIVAQDEDQAVTAAVKIGYPVIAKVLSDQILHRAKAGLVSQRLETEEEVRAAWRAIAGRHAQLTGVPPRAVLLSSFVEPGVEAFVGIKRDPEWGHTLALGLGGIHVEALGDSVVLALPTTPDEVRSAYERSTLSRVVRSAGVETQVDAFIAAVGAIAGLAAAGSLAELDVNPIALTPERIIALDALVRFDSAHPQHTA